MGIKKGHAKNPRHGQTLRFMYYCARYNYRSVAVTGVDGFQLLFAERVTYAPKENWSAKKCGEVTKYLSGM
jgi:hypothetical protein